MERNVCGFDRFVRLTAGPALLLVGYLGSRGSSGESGPVSPRDLLAAYAGAELVVTGLLQWCLGNYLLGIDTCERGIGELARSSSPF